MCRGGGEVVRWQVKGRVWIGAYESASHSHSESGSGRGRGSEGAGNDKGGRQAPRQGLLIEWMGGGISSRAGRAHLPRSSPRCCRPGVPPRCTQAPPPRPTYTYRYSTQHNNTARQAASQAGRKEGRERGSNVRWRETWGWWEKAAERRGTDANERGWTGEIKGTAPRR